MLFRFGMSGRVPVLALPGLVRQGSMLRSFLFQQLTQHLVWVYFDVHVKVSAVCVPRVLLQLRVRFAPNLAHPSDFRCSQVMGPKVLSINLVLLRGHHK